MNILKIGFSMSLYSGHSRPAFEIAHNLKHEGVNVSIVSSKLSKNGDILHQRLLKQEELSVNCYRPFNSKLEFMKLSRNSFTRELLSWADIIHVYGIYPLMLVSKIVPKGKKIVFTANSTLSSGLTDFVSSGSYSFRNLAKVDSLVGAVIPAIFFPSALSKVEKVICPTRFMENKVKSLGAQNTGYIPAGVNLNRFQITKNRVLGDFTFLYMGYLASARGIIDLLYAFELVNRKWRSTKLIISHTGLHPSEQKIILNRINQSASRNAIEVLGFCIPVSNVINRANVVVCPFRSTMGYSQPPLVVLESLAHGRPIITTSVGSLPEMVQEGNNGFRVPPRSPDQLANAMLRMRVSDLDFMSKNAKYYISQNHDLQKCTKSTIEVYKEVLQKNA